MKTITKGYDIYSAMNAQIVALLFLVCALATFVYHGLLSLGTLQLPAGNLLQEVAATESAIARLLCQMQAFSPAFFSHKDAACPQPVRTELHSKGLFARVGSGLSIKTAGVEVVF